MCARGVSAYPSGLSNPAPTLTLHYRHLVGRRCEVPNSGGRTVPIIADEYVDREFGTGALKITPGEQGKKRSGGGDGGGGQ